MYNEELFWGSSIEELKKGYIFEQNKKEYICIICGKEYKKGIIFNINDTLVDAEFAVKKHIEQNHISTFTYLLNLDKKYNGLSEIQKKIADGMHNNLSDSEITLKLNNKATSTIRNHRFVLREKYKESKIYIALMDLIKENIKDKNETKFINFHKSISVSDERTMVTENEKDSILKKYFDEGYLKLKRFPKKQKEKLVVLQQIIKNFKQEIKYTEKEINEVLKKIEPDYVTIRRYLIEYGFMNRKSDCSQYWVKQ